MSLRIVYEGDEAAAKLHLPKAENLMYKVREFVAASGAGVYSSRQVVDDRTYIFALKIGELEAIHIFTQPETPAAPLIDELKELPDILSGVVRGGWMRTEPVPGTTRQVKVLESFKPNALTAKRLQRDMTFAESRRLAVAPAKDIFDGISDGVEAPAERTPSQYVSIRPSNYTGRMQRLVQVCLGYGRLQPNRVHERNAARRSTVITEGLQMRYDYRDFRTHGIAVGKDDALWLIEVCIATGVLAMQLPVIPRTADMSSTVPADIAQVIEEFNGLPSGSGFPTGQQLARQIEEGLVLRLLTPEDMSEYYTRRSYYTACGWAFNADGTEAHNTCWDFDELGLVHGYHFSLDIEIGDVNTDREPGQPIAEATAKLTKVSDGRLYYPTQKPINGSYPLGIPQPPFKFYEPLLDRMFNFNFNPMRSDYAYPEFANKVMCDTTLHVYFGGGQLKKVNYFYDRTRKDVTGDIGDRDNDTYFFTAYSILRRVGVKQLPPMFYTSDIDKRRDLVEQSVRITSVPTYLGVEYQDVSNYGPPNSDQSVYAVEPGGPLMTASALEAEYGYKPFDGGSFMVVGIGEYRRTHRWMTFRTEVPEFDPEISSGIAIPEGARESYIYVDYYRAAGSNNGRYWTFYGISDHWEYIAWGIKHSANGPVEYVTASDGTYHTVLSDTKEMVHTDAWAGKGQPVSRISTPVVNAYQQLTWNPPTATFTTKLFTGAESGGLPLEKIEGVDEARNEWRLWYSDPSSLPGRPRVCMSAFHSADLGEFQMVYDTKLLGQPEHRKYMGSLVADQAGTALVKFNFIGVP